MEILKKLGFNQLTPIQEEMLKNINVNKHIVGLAPTGTGKTHAYLLPITNQLTPQAKKLGLLILLPTNELVLQVSKMLAQMETDFIIKSYYGSKDLDKESQWLKNNQPDIAILTPFKLFELVRNRNVLKIHDVQYFVLDEADMMFDEEFMKMIDDTLHSMTISKFLLFSASITKAMLPFIKKYFGNYLLIDTTNQHQLKIEQLLVKPTLNRDETLLNILKHINPFLGIIFASKKETTQAIYEILKEKGYNVCLFSSDLNVKQRKKLIEDIHNLKYQYVVASDLMARGIDFVASHVINYDIAHHLEYFIHRSGRTGRMNNSGTVITIQEPKDQSRVSKLKNMGINFELVTINKDGLSKIKKKPKGSLTQEEIDRLKAVKKPKKVTPGYKKKHAKQVKLVMKDIKKERFKRAVNR